MNDLDILWVGCDEVEVDKLSKAIHSIKEDVPFILFGEIKGDSHYFSLMSNGFTGVLENGEDATIERLHYESKHEFKSVVWQ